MDYPRDKKMQTGWKEKEGEEVETAAKGDSKKP